MGGTMESVPYSNNERSPMERYLGSTSSFPGEDSTRPIQVRHLGVKATHNSLGQRERYDQNFRTKFGMGATRELNIGVVDPYKTHKQCFRKPMRKYWLGGDMKYTGNSLASSQREQCPTPTLPRYPIDDEINPLGNLLGEILATACNRRSHPDKWKGRCSRFP